MVRGRSDMDSILFISPVFFDYYKAIIEEFTKLDYKVSWYGDRPSESFLSKIIIRLFPKLAVRKVDRYINKIISENSTVSFQYVVVIDGQCFQPKHIKKLKEKFSNARFIYYLWDSTTQFGFIEKLAPYFDKVFSFDRSDCDRLGFSFLPLFYIPDKKNNITNKEYEYSVIATIKPGKLNNYKKVKEIIPNNLSGKVFEHLFLHSKLAFIYYKIFDHKEFKGYKMSDFRYKKLSRDNYFNVLNKSKVTVDFQMKDQDGLTMRTFEALGNQIKLITTNQSISKYDFYNNKNIFVADGTENINIDFFLSPFDASENIIEKYSLKCFVKTMLGR